GERGHVDEQIGLVGVGVGEGIGEHQAALGVGVRDLDPLAAAHREHVAGTLRRRPGHVLGQRQPGGDPDRQTEIGDAEESLDDRADPAISDFMSSMLLAGLREMPPESKVIPLPTKLRWRLAPLGAYSTLTSRGPRVEPCPTPMMPPYPPA